MNFDDVSTVTSEQQRRNRELEQRLRIAEQDERFRLEWACVFPKDVVAMETFYAQKKLAKVKAAAKKKADRKKRRAEFAARKAERAENAARRARRAEGKKNGAGPSANFPSSSSFEWTTTPVSDTTPTSGSSDFNWKDSE
jgi:membrane protein involved in colicin uptake